MLVDVWRAGDAGVKHSRSYTAWRYLEERRDGALVDEHPNTRRSATGSPTPAARTTAPNQRGPVGPGGATGAKGPAGPQGPAGEAAPAAPIIKKGHCQLSVPADARAGKGLLIKCLHDGPELHHVSVTPVYHGGYAEPVYVMEPILDYSWKVDFESGSAGEIWVLIRILRDLPRPDLPKDILLNWIGTP